MIEPYYEDDHCIIYHGNCLEVDAWLTADVLVTDPPYGMAHQSNRRSTGPSKPIEGDGETATRDEVLRRWGSRPAVVFGTWRLPRPAAVTHMLVWDKGNDPGMGDLTMPWGHSHEDIYVMGDGFTIPNGAKRCPNVLKFSTVARTAPEREHPTPKPIPLMTHLLMRCPPGVIADPFVGSGATLRAAKDLGRKAIGVDLDERYCEIAANRLAQEVLAL